jgi:hypothetical protein
MTITTTHFEIVLFRDGKFIGQPLPCPTLRAAREEADDMVRGHLDSAGNRGPAREPVFELEAGEEPTEDGLYIRTVVTRREPTVVF